MSGRSPNLDKLKALHHLKRDTGLFVAIANDAVDQDPPTPVESGNLLEKAEEFCRRTRVVANKCKVFVGNVSYRVRSRELKEFFNSFGKVIYAEIIADHKTKRSRGFGFVTFSNEWEAQKAKESRDEDRTLEERVMKVCSPERKKKGRKVFHHETSLEEALQNYTKDGANSKDLDEAMEDESSDMVNADPAIFQLNEYTMLHIFSYLSVKDRIRIERVCRRWRVLAIKSWQHTTHLDFQGAFTSFKGLGGLTDEVLWSILRRGCQILKSLDLSLSPHFLTDFAVHCIAKQCKSLKELKISGVDVGTSSLKALSKGCSSLEKITLQKCYRLGEKALWWLFKDCKKLTHINLEGNKSLRGQCFFMLPPSCENLYLRGCVQLTDKGMGHLGDKCSNLKAINISECLLLSDEGIIQLTEHCCMIESLALSQAGHNVTSQGLQSIGNLTFLKELDLSKNLVVDDQVLFNLGKNCIHLTSLNLDSCQGGITDAGLQCLASCYQLSSIIISYLEKITDESVTQLAANGSLERAVARACIGLTDKTIEVLLKHCPDLKSLDVSGCTGITNTSLELLSLYCVSEDRPSLTCTVGGTAIDEEEISRVQPKLRHCDLVCSDYSMSEGTDAVPSYGSGAFYREEDEDDDCEFDDEFENFVDDDGDEHLHNVVDDEEIWMAEDSLWWRPEDAVDFLEADYPSLLAEQMYRT